MEIKRFRKGKIYVRCKFDTIFGIDYNSSYINKKRKNFNAYNDCSPSINLHTGNLHIKTGEWFCLEFMDLRLEVVAVTDAQFKWEKQVADIENILEKKPDIIVSIPVDPVLTGKTFQKAAHSGVKLVFMDNTPKDLLPGKDYVSVVSSDNYGNGVEAALIMAEKLGGKGKVGVIYHDADFFATVQRMEGFDKILRENYPEIKIVARFGFNDPNEGGKLTAIMLNKHQDLNGIFVVWDRLDEGAFAAARAAGRDDLVITTIDLGAQK
jgi:ribose transport system substrate-binding protein